METQVHIRKRRLTYMKIWKIVVLSFILTQSTSSALSTDSDQGLGNWEMCTFEEFDHNLCMLGAVKNTNTPSCLSRCCACPSGTFMDKFNNCSMCKPLRDCEAEGKRVLVKGSTFQDTVCGDDILVTTETWTTVPVISTLPTAVESSSVVIQPNQTKPHLAINTTCNQHGDDEGGGGTSVIRFDGGSAVLILLCTLLVICFLVILLFIRYPKIPRRLHALLSKKKPQTQRDYNSIPMKDLEVGGGKVTDV